MGLTPCREWQMALRNGYGVRWKDGKLVYMHRWIVEQIDGPEAIKGKVVMHLCDNRACYRYDHLKIGTQADNLADMRAKGRANDTTPCYGERHHRAKLTQAEVDDIRASDLQPKQLARALGVNVSTIHRILNGRTWAHAN